MIGQRIRHSTLGTGVVTEAHGSYITVKFPEKTCRFVYPDAFENHIRAEDPAVQAAILKELALRKQSEDERIRHEFEVQQAAAKLENSKKLTALMEELDRLIGLDQVKNNVRSLLNFIRICQLREQRGMKVPVISYHLVFTGNPGTGKTTVARIVAELYHLMGILPKGQLIETDRSGLVAGYLGQTALKTQKVIQEALGGVLFIDEAYSLANDPHDSYGKEAIETLLKAMEDHRNELVVIVAGYDNLMHQFIDSNPGLRSRFNQYFHFPDYSTDELLQIFEKFSNDNGYTLTDETAEQLNTTLKNIYTSRSEHFGNARTVRNLFESAIRHQSDRLSCEPDPTYEQLAELKPEDIIL